MLARFANGLYARVDQDGAFRDIEAAHRRRTLTLHRRPDGSGTIAGELTCEAAEYLETLFDTLGNRTRAPTVRATRAHPASGATTRCSAGSRSYLHVRLVAEYERLRHHPRTDRDRR